MRALMQVLHTLIICRYQKFSCALSIYFFLIIIITLMRTNTQLLAFLECLLMLTSRSKCLVDWPVVMEPVFAHNLGEQLLVKLLWLLCWCACPHACVRVMYFWVPTLSCNDFEHVGKTILNEFLELRVLLRWITLYGWSWSSKYGTW